MEQRIIVCRLGQQYYGLDIMRVRRIIPGEKPNRLPQAPRYIAGAVQYETNPLGVIDLCLFMNPSAAGPALAPESQLIVVAEDGSQLIGLLVDEVVDDLAVWLGAGEDEGESACPPVKPIPDRLRSSAIACTGVVQTGSRLILLLDLDQLLAALESRES